MDALMEESDGMHLVVCHLVGDHLRFMFFYQDIHWSSSAIYKFVVLIISSSPSFTGNTRRLWQKFGYIYTMHLGRGLYNRYPCLSCKLNKNIYRIGRELSACRKLNYCYPNLASKNAIGIFQVACIVRLAELQEI